MKKRNLITLTCMLCMYGVSSAQQGLNVTGSSTQINGMTFDYSIGEMVLVSTEKTSQYIITQGLLQPPTHQSTGSTEPGSGLDQLSESIRVYPNPSDNQVFVEWISSRSAQISYRLYDAAGKVVLSNKVDQIAGINKVSMEVKSLAAGTYYLMLDGINPNGNQLSFKIQKVR